MSTRNNRPFNNYVDKMRGEGVKKFVFVHAQCTKTVNAGGRGGGRVCQKWQNSVHVIVESPH